jgi:hypothetical protein
MKVCLGFLLMTVKPVGLACSFSRGDIRWKKLRRKWGPVYLILPDLEMVYLLVVSDGCFLFPFSFCSFRLPAGICFYLEIKFKL